MKPFLWLILIGFIKCAAADVLNGAIYNNGDGTYAVTVVDSLGHRFVGFADAQGEGVLRLKIGDSYGEIYTGRAIENDQNGYDLHLINQSTGKVTTGILEKN